MTTRQLQIGDLFIQRGIYLEIVRIEDHTVVYRSRGRQGKGAERRSPRNIFLAQIEQGVIRPTGRAAGAPKW
jgi:hypothetical protein